MPKTVRTSTHDDTQTIQVLCRDQLVVRRKSDGYVNATTLFRAVSVKRDKGRTIIKKYVPEAARQIVAKGGRLMRGAWVAVECARKIASHCGVEKELDALLSVPVNAEKKHAAEITEREHEGPKKKKIRVDGKTDPLPAIPRRPDRQLTAQEERLAQLFRALNVVQNVLQGPAFKIHHHDPTMEKLLTELSSTNPTRELPVVFIGESGAGKTNLINAILGQRLLPSDSTGTACTQFLCEIKYGQQTSLAVEYFSKREWEKQIESWLRLSVESTADGGESMNRSSKYFQILEELYPDLRDEEGYSTLGASVQEWMNALKYSIEANHPSAGVKSFAVGAPIEEIYAKIDEIGRSAKVTWIRRCEISCPAEILENGIVLVDLPGTNDTKGLRNSFVQDWIHNGRFVFIVTPIARAASNAAAAELLTSVLEYRMRENDEYGSIQFVCTCTDSIDGLMAATRGVDPRDAAAMENAIIGAIEQRNNRVRNTIARAYPGVNLDGKIFTVSSRYFLYSINQEQLWRPLITTRFDWTGIEAVRTSIKDMVCKSLARQIEELAGKLQRGVDLVNGFYALGNDASAEEKDILFNMTKDEWASLYASLDTYVTAHHAFHRSKLWLKHVRPYLMRNKDAIQFKLIDDFEEDLEKLRWNTLRKLMRHHGRNPTDAQQDINALLTKTFITINRDLLNKFWEQLYQQEANLQATLVSAITTSETHLATLIKTNIDVSPSIAELYRSRLSHTAYTHFRSKITGVAAQTHKWVSDVKKSFMRGLGDEVQAAMMEGYNDAAQERGHGIKERMIGVLVKHFEDTHVVDVFIAPEYLELCMRINTDCSVRGVGVMDDDDDNNNNEDNGGRNKKKQEKNWEKPKRPAFPIGQFVHEELKAIQSSVYSEEKIALGPEWSIVEQCLDVEARVPGDN